MVGSRHRIASHVVALGAFAVLAFGVSKVTQAQSNAPSAMIDSIHVVTLKAPPTVAMFRLVDRHEFGLPTGDIGYTYTDSADAPDVRLSAFFYQRDSLTRGLAPAAAVVRQAELFREALPIERARGVFNAYDIPIQEADSIVIEPNHVVVPGYRVFVAYRSRAGVYLSYFDVYAVGDGFIKIRYTVPVVGWEHRYYQGIAREIVLRAIQGS